MKQLLAMLILTTLMFSQGMPAPRLNVPQPTSTAGLSLMLVNKSGKTATDFILPGPRLCGTVYQAGSYAIFENDENSESTSFPTAQKALLFAYSVCGASATKLMEEQKPAPKVDLDEQKRVENDPEPSTLESNLAWCRTNMKNSSDMSRCESNAKKYSPLDLEEQRFEEQHEKAQAEEQQKLNVINRAWSDHKPLPGLPSLRLPVHIKNGAYVCNTDGELLNPNWPELLYLKECAFISQARANVKVLQPQDFRSYMSGYHFNIIEISWQTGDIADGNVFTGWAHISDLSN